MKKLLLTLAVALTAMIGARAEEYSLSFADATDVQGTFVEEAGSTKAHYQPVESLKIGDFRFAFAATDSAKNKPALYHLNATPTLRVYTGGIVSISAPSGVDMGSIQFACSKVAGVGEANPIICSEGGTVTVSGKTITWVRPETEVILDSVTFYLPDTPMGKTNPNVQIESAVVSTAVIEPEPVGITFVKTDKVTSGARCALVVGDKAATAIAENKSYGYIFVVDAAVTGNSVVLPAECAFKFTAVDGGYTIQQADDRYLYMKGTYNSFNLDATAVDGSLWTVEVSADGVATIVNAYNSKTLMYAPNYSSFGAYPTTEGYEAPVLYVESSTAIEGVESETTEAPVEYYNLQGVRVYGDVLPAGVYVRRQGTVTTKVLVK